MFTEKSLNVLVVGSGGREHALVRSCAASPLVRSVIAAPGNGGMDQDCDCALIPADDIGGLVNLAVEKKIDFVIVGPEVPLSLGLVDALKEKQILAFGPEADGARLEASKIACKQLLLKYRIPTGASAVFDSLAPALSYLETSSYPIVIKADGLAAGKGVIIAEDHEAATATVRSMLEDRAFGDSGERILVEECLVGEETSIHVIISGRDYVILPTSQDHKRIGEGDTGPNTGGMGAYSPAGLVDDALMQKIRETIVVPSVEAIASEGIAFRGVLFIGIMVTSDGPKVLEYNVRFGDPETQVLLPRLKTDPVALMLAAATGRLAGFNLEVRPEHALCVVLASRGYPGSYPKGETVTLPTAIPDYGQLFHAGTKAGPDRSILTNGGRIFGVTALGQTLPEAADRAYRLCDQVLFDSKVLRRDIGARQLRRGTSE
ncbi:MAG: phosphoribosylamine--glycine ligase [Verrucomicrobia bacterium]|nr:MAG: phosphoribosylamine--glycine ligase [Verrucomicrobiota bacterium]